MKIKIEEIKKYRNNNLKLECKFYDYIGGLEEFSDTFIAVVFVDTGVTVHAKTGKLKINATTDYQKASLDIILKQESDINQFLKILDFQYNYFDFVSFAYSVYSEFDCEFTLMNTKKIDYKKKLLNKIHGLFSIIAKNTDSEKKEVKKQIKHHFGIESFADIEIKDLEKVYNFTVKLAQSTEEQDSEPQDDLQTPY